MPINSPASRHVYKILLALMQKMKTLLLLLDYLDLIGYKRFNEGREPT